MAKNKIQVKAPRGKVVKAPNGVWVGDIREHNIEDIQGMILADYLRMDKRVLNAQQKTFWDAAILAPNKDLTQLHVKELFRHGYTDEDTVWNDPTTEIQQKGEIMTNMIKDGEFPQGTLTILKRIEVDIDLSSSGAAAYTNVGFVADATANNVANYDPALLFNALKKQVMLTLKRGANKQIICEGLLEEFPITCSASGAGSGAFFIQNGPGVVNDEKLMFPEIFEGGEDFWIELKPLNEKFKTPVPVVVMVKLKTTQVFTVYR